MKAHAESVVSDADFAKRAERWAVDTPDTKEGYYIREIFESKSFLTSSKSILTSFLFLFLFLFISQLTRRVFGTKLP